MKIDGAGDRLDRPQIGVERDEGRTARLRGTLFHVEQTLEGFYVEIDVLS